MMDHLKAVAAKLAELGYPVHIGWAYGSTDTTVPAVPYIVLAGPGWGIDPAEMPVAGADDALDAPMRLTAVGGNPEAAGIVLGRARALLSPRMAATPLTVDGRSSASIQYTRSEFIGVDRDVTITNTNRHPGVGVESYRIRSDAA